jgi:hypothetical protein
MPQSNLFPSASANSLAFSAIYGVAYALQGRCWPRGFFVARAVIDLWFPRFRIIYPWSFPSQPDSKRAMACRCYRWWVCDCREWVVR